VIPGLEEHHKVQISRLFQGILIGFILVGALEQNMGLIVNSFVGLVITLLPEILERDYKLTMSPWIVLWIASAVFFHAFGVLGPYNDIWWWDHFTHTLSASLVAGAGYATFSAFNNHMEDIHIPEKFMFVFILIFVMAFGVFWEVMEFGLHLLSNALGADSVLTQHGIEDTMKDLLFDTVGAILVALFGSKPLGSVIEDIEEKIDRRLKTV
jgi:hypothetical protein